MTRGRLGRTQADAVIAELIDIKRQIDALIEALQQGKTPERSVRNYDIEPQDAEELAEQLGIDLHADDAEDTTPEWFKARYGHLAGDPEVRQGGNAQ